MDSRLYPMIFKRKSFHIFRDIGSIDTHELQCIEKAYKTFTPLVSDIKTAIKIVPAEEKRLTVYRYKKPGKRGIMPADKVAHYNRIDIGIFLCFLELSLMENSISFERELFTDTAEDDCEEVPTARYTLI